MIGVVPRKQRHIVKADSSEGQYGKITCIHDGCFRDVNSLKCFTVFLKLLSRILSGFMKKSKAKLMSECDHELAAVLFSREKDKNRTRVEKITSEADAIRKRQILPTQ